MKPHTTQSKESKYRISPWLLPILWTICVLAFSSVSFSAQNTQNPLLQLLSWVFPSASPETLIQAHGLLRKAGHVIEYALLSRLWFQPLRQHYSGESMGFRLAGQQTLLICLWVAILDESHQALIPERSGSPHDVLLDSLAAAVVQLVIRWRHRTQYSYAHPDH